MIKGLLAGIQVSLLWVVCVVTFVPVLLFRVIIGGMVMAFSIQDDAL